MKRIYIAGAYSAPNVLGVFANMRRGIDLAQQAEEASYAVFAPWHDIIGHLHPLSHKTLKQCYEGSMAWLEVSDAVLVVNEGWSESRGTVAEIDRAHKLGIPVVWSLEELKSVLPPESNQPSICKSAETTTKPCRFSLWNFAKRIGSRLLSRV